MIGPQVATILITLSQRGAPLRPQKVRAARKAVSALHSGRRDRLIRVTTFVPCFLFTLL